MITNELEYKLATTAREALAVALESTSMDNTLGDDERDLLVLGAKFRLQELDSDIAQYEALRDGSTDRFDVNFNHLDEALVLLRHLKGMSQAELAERLGIKQQQVQRYEAKGYEQASYGRLKEVIWALNCELNVVVHKSRALEREALSPSNLATPEVTFEQAPITSGLVQEKVIVKNSNLRVMPARSLLSAGAVSFGSGGEPFAAR